MKQRRNRAVIFAGSLILAAIAVRSLIQIHEEDRPLPQFQTQAGLHDWATNSLPLLLEWLRLDQADYRQPLFVSTVNDLLDQQRIIRFRMGSAGRPNRMRFAYDTFCDIGADGKAAIPGLISLLGEKSERTSGFACLILERMTPASIPALSEVLTNGNERARMLAATGLRDIGPDAKVTAPALRRTLADGCLPVRFAAGCALASFGDNSNETLKVILEGISSGDSDMCGTAFETLGRLGASAHPAVPGLVAIITNTATGEHQRLGSVWMLKSIDRGELLRAVAGLNDTALRSNILTKLKSFDPGMVAEMQAKVDPKP